MSESPVGSVRSTSVSLSFCLYHTCLLWLLLTSWLIETQSIPRSPLVRAFSSLQSLRHLLLNDFAILGLHNGVLAYPRPIASYAVSVRQYRILQSRFLQCIPHGKPPCGLLILPGVTPVYKGFEPSGKIHQPLRSKKLICIFNLFLKL